MIQEVKETCFLNFLLERRMIMDMTIRPRRLRGSEVLRKMVRETRMDKSSLIYPLFVREGENIREEIPSMPGQYRYTLDQLPYCLEELTKAGVGSVLLFGIPDVKDEVGSGAYAQDGIIQKALRLAKKEFPDLYYITDVCMCEYTSHVTAACCAVMRWRMTRRWNCWQRLRFPMPRRERIWWLRRI